MSSSSSSPYVAIQSSTADCTAELGSRTALNSALSGAMLYSDPIGASSSEPALLRPDLRDALTRGGTEMVGFCLRLPRGFLLQRMLSSDESDARSSSRDSSSSECFWPR